MYALLVPSSLGFYVLVVVVAGEGRDTRRLESGFGEVQLWAFEFQSVLEIQMHIYERFLFSILLGINGNPFLWSSRSRSYTDVTKREEMKGLLSCI